MDLYQILRYMNDIGLTSSQEAMLANYIIQKVNSLSMEVPMCHIFSM